MPMHAIGRRRGCVVAKQFDQGAGQVAGVGVFCRKIVGLPLWRATRTAQVAKVRTHRKAEQQRASAIASKPRAKAGSRASQASSWPRSAAPIPPAAAARGATQVAELWASTA